MKSAPPSISGGPMPPAKTRSRNWGERVGVVVAVVGMLLAAPLVCYMSGAMTVGIDETTNETVGITRFRGFPIWFYEQAPGISIMGSWHFDRFVLNLVFWVVFLQLLLAVLFWRMRARRRS